MVTNEQIQELFQKVKKNVNLEEKIINKFNVNKKMIKLKDDSNKVQKTTIKTS